MTIRVPAPGADAQSDGPRPDSEETVRLLDRLGANDSAALPALLARHQPALRAYVDLRFDRALRGRLDPSDVVQESLIAITDRLPDFLSRRPAPFHVWARQTARERYLNLREFHLAHRRDARRELGLPDSSAEVVAEHLASAGPGPGEAADVRERVGLLARAIGMLAENDREVLLLRVVEQLPHAEIACELGISVELARQRYGRGLDRLARQMAALGGRGGD